MTSLYEAWQTLSEPWQLAFDQAWAAYQDNCCPVGSIILDPNGAVVAQAHNRVRTVDATARELADTRLAHAPLNALAQIPTVTQHLPAQVYTTLEPCIMCMGAATTLRVPTVKYASPEFFSGAILAITSSRTIPALAELRLSTEGPLDNPISDLFLHLYVAFHSWASPDGVIARSYRANRPTLYTKARVIAEAVEEFRLSADRSLEKTISELPIQL